MSAFVNEYEVRRAVDPEDRHRLYTALELLRWIGRDNPGARYNLGILALRGNDLDTAIHELERSIELGPTLLSRIALGTAHQRGGNWEAALAANTAALELDPNSVPALTQAAHLKLKLGDLEGAEAALSHAVALAPERAALRARLERLRDRRIEDPSG